jgi:hypothetical protein
MLTEVLIIMLLCCFILLLIFLMGWMEFNSGLHPCKAGTPKLPEPYLQSILLWLFWKWGLANCLPGLTFILLISASQVARITDIEPPAPSCCSIILN